MPNRVAEKVALITGGGSGMGRAAAMLLAAEGARVAVGDINRESGERIVQAILNAGHDAIFVPVDVRSSGSVEEMVNRVVARYGRIDVLLHSAIDGRFVNEQDRRLTELPDETWQQMLDLVLSGAFRCAKYVGRQMLAQKSGAIILMATTDALIGCAGLDAYTAAKGGVVAMTRSFAAGVARDGVRVNAVCPGFVATEPQLSWLERPGARALMESLHLLPIPTPEQVAPLILYLASDDSSPVTGAIFPIDSGYTAFKANLDVMGAVGPAPETEGHR